MLPARLCFELSDTSWFTRQIRSGGIERFDALCAVVAAAPYGRVNDQNDPLAVLVENRGTCSTKHRLLAAVAQASDRPDIRLIVGIYRMSEANTPGVEAVLTAAGLPYILEAHCYLESENQRFDFTGLRAGSASVFSALVSEHNVPVESLAQEKAVLHRAALNAWAPGFGLSFEQAWSIREACIAALQA